MVVVYKQALTGTSQRLHSCCPARLRQEIEHPDVEESYRHRLDATFEIGPSPATYVCTDVRSRVRRGREYT